MSVDADGSLWLVRGGNTVSDAPLCHATDQAVKCFGKADGVSISPADALLPDPDGGFWLGGQTALVRWRAGVSETYPVEGLKSNGGNNGIVSLARDRDGTLWVGILATGPGHGLGQWRNGAFTPFRTPTFDGATVAVYTTIVDHDGSLWVGTNGKGLFRIHAGNVEHYGRDDGLSSDSVQTLFEDRTGIVWAVTPPGAEGHYGLRGMRERATVIGSKLTVRSEPGEGTEVELGVPGAVACATSLQQGRIPVNGV